MSFAFPAITFHSSLKNFSIPPLLLRRRSRLVTQRLIDAQHRLVALAFFAFAFPLTRELLTIIVKYFAKVLIFYETACMICVFVGKRVWDSRIFATFATSYVVLGQQVNERFCVGEELRSV